MGTPEFAVDSLKSLINSEDEVVAVFTQPDKPKGRGYKLTPSPIKEVALANGITVFTPNSLKTDEAYNVLTELSPDLIVVVAYGKILPKRVLELPKYGCINVHGSLLPKYRGAAPIQWAVINGEKETGVTTMLLNEGIDTGDMLLKSVIEIDEKDNAGDIHDRMAIVGAKTLVDTINALKSGKLVPEKQDDSLSSYVVLLNKENTKIDFTRTALEVYNLIRGLAPSPCAYCYYEDSLFKILSSEICENKHGNSGEIIIDNGFYVCCSDFAVKLIQIKPEGSKIMNAQDYIRGHNIKQGSYMR